MTKGPIDLVRQVAAMLDELGIEYALGGSVAMAFFGEPRSTNDVDLAIVLGHELEERLISDATAASFYVPAAAVHDAIRDHSSFNLIDVANALKVDLFVVGKGLLDQRQISRRVLMAVPGADQGVWVTAPDDLVLRKLDWYRRGESDRQWRDVVGMLRVLGNSIDLDDLRSTAAELDLGELLEEALAQAED